MKTFKSLVFNVSIFLFSISIISCSDDTTVSPSSSSEVQLKSTIQTYEQLIDIEAVDGKVYSGTMYITQNDDTGDLVKVAFSQNLYDANIGINPDPIAFAAEVTAFAEGEGQQSHSDCIQECRDQFIDAEGNRKKGFGACRFNCWVDTTVRILEAVAEISTVFKK